MKSFSLPSPLFFRSVSQALLAGRHSHCVTAARMLLSGPPPPPSYNTWTLILTCSCINHLDKLVVYNGKTTNKSAIMDVFCGIKSNKKLLSTGPFLVIEFESGSAHGGHGFSARYRFTELEGECTQSQGLFEWMRHFNPIENPI